MLMNGLEVFILTKPPLGGTALTSGLSLVLGDLLLSTITKLLKFVTAILAPGHWSISAYHMLHAVASTSPILGQPTL